ncbi:MAG: hypothetical protein HYU52_11015 [Acidobacteria bacterium]|nr:hypothetical protein [Acidobacteriota bacterium]
MNATAAPPDPQSFADLKGRVLDEVIRQFRATRNDILRYGVWNARNLSDEEFNRTDDRKLLGYFRQDLLETRFVHRGIRIDLIQLWHWFDDQMSGLLPLSIAGEEVYIIIQDKDLEKLRKRISELESFMAMLRLGDLDAFTRVKYKLRRTVLRLTYDIHHLNKRLDKYRKSGGFVMRHDEAAHDEPHPPSGADDGEHTEGHDEAGS